MTLVVDASVAFAWFVAEAASPQAHAVLASAELLIAPELLLAETVHAMWKAVRGKLMSPIQQDEAIARLPALLNEWVAMRVLAPRTAVIARTLDHPAYDCFYLALAEQRQATLVTADRRLQARVMGTAWATLVVDIDAWRTA